MSKVPCIEISIYIHVYVFIIYTVISAIFFNISAKSSKAPINSMKFVFVSIFSKFSFLI